MVDNQLGRGEEEGDEEDEQVGQNLFDQQPFPPAPQNINEHNPVSADSDPAETQLFC